MAAVESDDVGPPRKGLSGLNNLGNTCYFNAALQCLLHLEPMKLLFSTIEPIHPLPKSDPKQSFMAALEHEYLSDSNIRVVVAAYFSLMLRCVWSGQKDVIFSS